MQGQRQWELDHRPRYEIEPPDTFHCESYIERRSRNGLAHEVLAADWGYYTGVTYGTYWQHAVGSRAWATVESIGG